MKVSIIICTRNRADELAATLASVGQCEVPDGFEAELIVVDNGSTDQTREVIASAPVANLPMRSVREPLPGLSRARNRGMGLAGGDILMFTDDDVRAPRDWIGRMCAPIIGGECDATVGGITPGAGREVPGVLLPPVLFDPAALTTPPILIGANMAFHRRVFEAVGGFDTNLGAGALGMGEETLFSYLAKRAGFRIAVVNDAPVEHWFDVDRCGDDDQRKTARQLARAWAYMDYHYHRKVSKVSGESALKSWFWLCRFRLKRRCFGSELYPLTGWELHQEGEVAYFREYRSQRRSLAPPELAARHVHAVRQPEPAVVQAL